MDDTAIELINDLSQIGIFVEDLYDLVESKVKYGDGIPILLKYLSHPELSLNDKEAIVRALGTKEAVGIVNDHLLNEFNENNKSNELYLWAVANSIEIVVRDQDFNKICSIIKDEGFGISREMLVLSLGKIKSKESEEFLINLLENENLASFAISGLVKLKSLKAICKISQLVSSSNKRISKEAKKALIKLNKYDQMQS